MKTKPLNLIRLILANLVGLFSDAKNRSSFPAKIDSYQFVKVIKNHTRGNNLAIYLKGSKRIIVKTYQGKLKSMDYYILKNEIAVSKILNKVISRIKSKTPQSLKGIYLPKIILVKETTNKLFVGFEYIKSKTLKEKTTKKQLSVYFKVKRYLEFLDQKISVEEKRQISKRTSESIFKLYLPLLIKAIFTHPKVARKLLTGILVFLRLRKKIEKLKIVLSHRDLHLENILISKKGIYIVDLEFTLFAPEIYEEITTLRYEWTNSKFRDQFLKRLVKRYQTYKNIAQILKVVALNVATHSLSANNFPTNLRKNYFKLLEYSIKEEAFKKYEK